MLRAVPFKSVGGGGGGGGRRNGRNFEGGEGLNSELIFPIRFHIISGTLLNGTALTRKLVVSPLSPIHE